jgi:NADPH2:quinone reductase
MLSVEDVPAREPGPGEVRLRVRAAGVNFPDVLIIQKKYQLQPTLPFTPGAEAAGDVLAVGPDVANLEPGDRVACLCHVGGFAEELVVPAIMCVPIPDGVPDDVAGSFTLVYGTSWHAIRDRAALRPGETMLVLGAAGGVGLAAVEIGKATGARVIAAASSDEKLRVCHAHGADATINYATEDLREGIKRLTDGKGPDVVYDPVGGKYAELAFRSIGWRGRYLVIGFADGAIPTIAWNLPLLKGASIVGVFWGDFVRREPQNHQRDMADLLAWIREGKLRPLVSKSYSLEQTPLALSDMASRKVVGKVVIVP